MDKILSVIIPSYNVAGYLPEIMPFYFKSGCMKDIELLIVNDGSKDNTAEIAEMFRTWYPDSIRVINKENGGHGSTINAGIQHAQGKYFKVIDGDDWVDSEAFARYIEKLKNCSVDMIISPFNRVDELTKKVTGTVIYPELQEGNTYDLSVLLEFSRQKKYAMHSLTIRTDILKKIQPISEHCFYVDMEYIVYPLEYVNTIGYVNETIYQYRVGSANQSMALTNMIKNRKMHLHVIRQLENYYELSSNETVRSIVSNQLRGLYDTQINTYCAMPISRETKKELQKFIRGTKKAHPSLRKNLSGKKTKILFATNGIGYELIAAVFQRVKK